jgi:hypothetical protein
MDAFDFAAENSNERLESMLLQNPKNDLLWEEYAKWLIQRGDPRGELVLLNKKVEYTSRNESDPLYPLVGIKNRSKWFGDLLDEQPSLDWQRGFPVKLTAYSYVSEERLTALLKLRAFRFLRELSIVSMPKASLHGLCNLPLLEKLSLDFKDVETLRSLPSAKPRSLKKIKFESHVTLDESLVAALATVTWLRELDEVRFGVFSIDDQEVLLKHPGPFAAMGPALKCLASGEGWRLYGDELRRALPHADMRPMDLRFKWKFATTPGHVHKDFRNMAPLVSTGGEKSCDQGCCYSWQYNGSGKPASDAGHPNGPGITRCLACGSRELMLIHVCGSCRNYRRECETVTDEDAVYECKTCRQFTLTESHRAD